MGLRDRQELQQRRITGHQSAVCFALLAHRRDCLTPEEFDRLLDRRLSDYYQFLSASLLRDRNRAFWAYHKVQLDATTGFSWARLGAVILKARRRNPQRSSKGSAARSTGHRREPESVGPHANAELALMMTVR